MMLLASCCLVVATTTTTQQTVNVVHCAFVNAARFSKVSSINRQGMKLHCRCHLPNRIIQSSLRNRMVLVVVRAFDIVPLFDVDFEQILESR